MNIFTTRGRLLASSILAGATLFSAVPAIAQEAEAEGEIIVTGSRIPQPNLETASPVTQVTAEDVAISGVTRIEDLVTQLPQAFAAQNSTVSNGASGTATVDLRQLGSVRTLVLIDGRRMGYGSPNDAAADINQIPTQLVERVEVLTGGASAVYGSDAVAGVVNFIMRDDFEGFQLNAQYGFFQADNNFDGPGGITNTIRTRAATNPSQFRLPPDTVIDGYSREIGAIMGVSTDDDRGNITVYASYRNNSEILQANRDFSACAIGAAPASGANFTCGGSSTAFPGRFVDFANGAFDFTLSGTGQATRPWNGALDQYNFGPLNFFQRPDERYAFGAFGRYEINDNVEAFTQLMFTDYSTVAQIAPSGIFLSEQQIPCNNPLLSAGQRTLIGCGAVGPTDSVAVTIGRRNVEGGGRQDDLGYQSFRGVVGLRGPLVEGWDYEMSAQYSRVELSRIYRNEFSNRKISRALDVVPGPGGVPTCRSVIDGSDPNCVPFNLWTIGGITPQARDYIQSVGIQTGQTEQQVLQATVFGDLGGVGFTSPFATNSAGAAFGIEYRRDTLVAESDESFRTNDLAGQGGPTIPLAGGTDVFDIFGELRIPLVEDRPFFELLEVGLAYRYSDYSIGEATNTYSINGEWSPVSDLRLRGSFQVAVRAPNVIELFEAQGLNLFDLDEDPCGPARTATLAECQATGVTAAQYGSPFLDSPAGQYNVFEGGNPNLSPEEAETITVGFVLTPEFLPGFNASVDYFQIEVTELVSTFGPLNTLAACYDRNVQAACALINRNANGQLWTDGGFVEDFNINIGGIKTSGFDFNANYGFELAAFGLPDVGGLSFNFAGTLLESLETDPGAGSTIYDCVGFYGNQCGTPTPKWRHRASVTWETPLNADITATWRHLGEVELFAANFVQNSLGNRVDRFFEAENYLDLAATWQVTENAVLRFGVNNVLENDPPLSASVGTTGNGNTYPQTYDANGRFFFAGITVDF